MNGIKYFDFFGLKLSIFDPHELTDYFLKVIRNNKKVICYGYSFGTLPYFKPYPEIAVYGNRFDVSVADGRGLFLFARLLGKPIKSDMSIPSMVDSLLELADKNNFSVMLLGARDDINLKATENLKNKFPGAAIIRGIHGYFKEFEEDIIVSKINKYSPDILLIGISSPKKERFAFLHSEELNCRIVVPCGGVIDILAGHKKRTPKFVKRAGLAWLYRFVQEPKRLFRDSIINSLSVLFRLIPTLLFKVYVLREKDFSIPKFYNSTCEAPIE